MHIYPAAMIGFMMASGVVAGATDKVMALAMTPLVASAAVLVLCGYPLLHGMWRW